jgi:hypothetical protein
LYHNNSPRLFAHDWYIKKKLKFDQSKICLDSGVHLNLHQDLHYFADIIVIDALYANEPFLTKVCSLRMDVVVRMKDERLHIMKDARGLFENRESDYTWTEQRSKDSILVDVWWDSFSFGPLDRPLHMYRFKETIHSQEGQNKKRSSKPESKETWVATTSERFAPKSLDTTDTANPKLTESGQW